MTTILVPTDFSPVSKNAALYAFGLAEQLRVQRVILYNTYQGAPTIINETGMPAMPLQITDIELLKDVSSDNMKQFRQAVEEHCPQDVVISEITEFGTIEGDISEICINTGAELIIMGITGASKMEEILLGSTATTVATHTKVPVIVVPENTVFAAIKKVMLACDFKNITETMPVKSIKNLLSACSATLDILNIREEETDVDKAAGQQLLSSLLQEFNPDFYFVPSEDFITGINDFADAHKTNLIITIPKKHSFFQRLFKERHTKKLAFNSHVPVMYIHDEDL